VHRLCIPWPILFTDLVTNDTAHCSTANRADRASASENRTGDASNTGTDRGILILFRHAGTTAQTKQKCRGHRSGYDFVCGFHWNTFHWNTFINKNVLSGSFYCFGTSSNLLYNAVYLVCINLLFFFIHDQIPFYPQFQSKFS
jgi:hypothetical protein